jgi:GR25 family glycosyltransferase involved in LPS biosynthesis
MGTKEGGYIIHLERAVEREGAVEAIRRSFFMPLAVAPASNGEAWMRNEAVRKRHVLPGQQVTQGMLGCAESHMDLLRHGFQGGFNEFAIFEDDCEFLVGREAVKEWVDRIQASGAPWDILLLGANEYVDQARAPPAPAPAAAGPGVVQVGRFWGTHAMILRPRAVKAAMNAFVRAQVDGIFLPADWMYNEAIRREGLICLGPTDPKGLCRQIPGFISAITGKVRA